MRLVALEDLRVGWLKVFPSRRLHLDNAAVGRPETDGAWVEVGAVGLAIAGDHV